MTSLAAEAATVGQGVPDALALRFDPGARRLRALNGAQPATDHGCSVFFAGTLYNRVALGARSSESERTDADILLSAYRRWGATLADRLEGNFALVVWDAERETLLCVRDPLGIYPLFYAAAGRDLILATSIDAVLEQSGVSRSLSRAALADHLCHRWPDRGETYFEEVRRVPPGHTMTVIDGRRDVVRYWNPAPPGEPVDWIREDELDQFDELLDQAVGRGLALGPAGIFLSGGLDSVSVAATAVDRARREGSPPPLALSLVFPTLEANEETVQRGVAEGLGLAHVLLDFEDAAGTRGLLTPALEISAGLPSPLLNVWFPAYRTLTAEGASRGCRVILTGGGGDEWLTVSPFLAADRMRSADVRGLASLWSMMNRSYRLSRLATLRSVLWTFGGKPLVAAGAERYAPSALAMYRRRQKRRLTPAWIAPDPALRRDIFDRAAASVLPTTEAGFYLREGQLSLDHSLISMEMEELHETGLRTGVPVRMPFWDAQLVDFLYRTPPELLNEGGRAKGLVRQMLARKFPELGFERHRKVLATNYFTEVMAREVPGVWRKLGGAPALESLGIVDGTQLQSAVREVFERNQHQGVSRIWNLLTVEAWVRSHL